MGWLRRVPIVVLLWALAVSMTSAGVLAAGNPGREFLPAPPDVSGPFCGPSIGTVVAHIAVSRQYIKAFTSKDGTLRIEINGFVESTVTANGKTLSFNSSGPLSITFHPDDTVTLVGQGHTFVINPTGPNTGILLVTGRVTVDQDTGAVIVLSGHVTDVCPLLAA
jgi:hypothetical protein